MRTIVCTPRVLTDAQRDRARYRSVEINPANALEQRVLTRTPVGRRGGPRRLTLSLGTRWPATGVQLTVQFLDDPERALRKRLLQHMNAWSKTANVAFVETAEVGQVRIARLTEPSDEAGYWSYVGTDILGIDDDDPTMNLDGFTMKTPESEFLRVVRHETGHTLGFEHEHMRKELVAKIDVRKAIAYFDRTEGWTAQDTRDQVLTPLAQKSVIGTVEADPVSVMCYQIPGAITKNGKAIAGGKDITRKDYEFAARVYPKVAASQSRGAREVDAATITAGKVLVPAPSMFSFSDDDTLHVVVMDRFDSITGERLAKDKANFVRLYASYGGARVTAPMRVNSADSDITTYFGDIIATHERIKSYMDRMTGTLPSEKEMLKFGSQLFDTLFQGDIRRLYDEARSRQDGRKLNLVVTSMVSWIAEKPWEFAYDAQRRSFLATEDIHFIRNVLTPVPAERITLRPAPLRMLIVAAQPVGTGQLSIEQEMDVIRRGFRPLIDANLLEVEILARATPSEIHSRLSTGRFTVVHFIGHGRFDEHTQEGALIFEDGNGGTFTLKTRSAREIFCQRGVALIFLNACQTGAGGVSDFNKGVAQALVAGGVPALVANQYSVFDASATHFAQHFYWALATGQSIGAAAREARIAVNYSTTGDTIDWAVPVVYARDPGMTFVAESGGVNRAPAMGMRRNTRRSDSSRPCAVGVWDVDSAFPSLGNILEQMTAAQGQFSFDLVGISAPIDIWDLSAKAPDGSPYLWASKLASGVARMPLELGVTTLICVTRHWLSEPGEKRRNFFTGWSLKGDMPVMVVSVAGFDDLPAEGPRTAKAITNLLASTLAGYLGRMKVHKGGQKSCVFFRNIRRDVSVIIAPKKFDKGCRRKIREHMSESQVQALESLLKVSIEL